VNDILSQDEIDALLHGVSDGDVETETGTAVPPGGIQSYDLASQDRIVRGRIPALEMINDRFARKFRDTLAALLRTDVNITAAGVQMLKFAEYTHSLFVPTCLNLVHVQPLRGTALFVVEPRLVFALVDTFFGGGKFESKIENREFTPTELRVVRKVLDGAFADMAKAWQPVLPARFEFQSTELNPQFASVAEPTDVVVVNGFRIEMDGRGGDFQVSFPYAMLDPLRAAGEGNGKRGDSDARWQRVIRERIKEADVEISSVLTETRLSLRELNGLKPGDVIPIELPDLVVVEAESVPVFHGKFGLCNGNRSIKIVDRILPETE